MRIGRTRLRLAVFIAAAVLLTYSAGALLGSVAQVALATALVCGGLFIAAGVPLEQILALKTSISNDRRRRLETDISKGQEQEAIKFAMAAIAEERRAAEESLRASIARSDDTVSRLKEQVAELSAATRSLHRHLEQVVETTTEQSIQMQRVIAVVETRTRRAEQPGDSVSTGSVGRE